jgi:hypothetical protein
LSALGRLSEKPGYTLVAACVETSISKAALHSFPRRDDKPTAIAGRDSCTECINDFQYLLDTFERYNRKERTESDAATRHNNPACRVDGAIAGAPAQDSSE